LREDKLRAEVMRPSALGRSELAAWRQLLDEMPAFRRAFLTPSFALVCEKALGRAYVAVLHDGSGIRGFLPFQFRSAWHQRLRLAELIGGNLSQGAGLIAGVDLRTDPASLLRLAGLASLQLSHLIEDSVRFGLEADRWEPAWLTAIEEGPDAFFAGLLSRNRGLVRDTERQQRRAEKSYGNLVLESADRVPPDQLADLIDRKRRQYRRTAAQDPFDDPSRLRLIEALNETPATECRVVAARLRAGSQVLAQHLGLQCHDLLSWWFPVYDPSMQGLSPGRLLLWEVIRHAPEHGVKLIEYGEGEAQYKQQFGNRAIRLGRAFWHAGTVRSLAARLWQSAEWRSQRWGRRTHNLLAALGALVERRPPLGR